MPFLLAEQRRGWRQLIFCARATRGLRRPSLDARSGRSISPHPSERKRASLEGSTVTSLDGRIRKLSLPCLDGIEMGKCVGMHARNGRSAGAVPYGLGAEERSYARKICVEYVSVVGCLIREGWPHSRANSVDEARCSDVRWMTAIRESATGSERSTEFREGGDGYEDLSRQSTRILRRGRPGD